ncbi:MAG TPA: protein kinase [Pyrinomonadaceae bacterium]
MKYCTVCKAKYEDSVSFCPVDGEVLVDDPSSIVNTVLDGQYQIESMLGKGGMGAVYRARHILLGDRVAIKILPPEVRNNAEWLRRFRREGQAARRFRHPNAVTVYDLRTSSDGTIYMVMEYVEGHTLDAELKQRGRLSCAEAFTLLEPIMSVLNTAHAMGVVHRDLKPENIMIGKSDNHGEPVVKLLDLGIAKMREIAGENNGGTTALTMAGQVLGTPYYMSPEQWGEIPRDGNPEIDGRADIYSLGLVFYELIVGRRSTSGKTLSELRREHVSVIPRPLHEVVPSVPLAFSKAITRATAKDRSERQETAGELAAELRSAVHGQSVMPDRTVPDLPHIDSTAANTSGIPGSSETNSDVDAPTIITIDTPGTAGPSVAPVTASRSATTDPQPRPVLPIGSNAPSVDHTVIESGSSIESSITIPKVPRPVTTQPTAPQTVSTKSKGGSFLLLGAGALIFFVLVVGVGGFFGYRWYQNKSATTTVVNNGTSNGKTSTNEAALATKDFGRYWLELLPVTGIEDVQVAGTVPLASGQPFKFHFQFEEDGYLYIVGPGQGNQQTAFLTAKPPKTSGITSNKVQKSRDFSFPSGITRWLELDSKPGTENYTIIFSSTPLLSPAFLNEEATGDPMTESQKVELEDFLAKNKSTPPTTEIDDKDSAAPFMQIKVPQTSAAGNPIIFPIRIQHN